MEILKSGFGLFYFVPLSSNKFFGGKKICNMKPKAFLSISFSLSLSPTLTHMHAHTNTLLFTAVLLTVI